MSSFAAAAEASTLRRPEASSSRASLLRADARTIVSPNDSRRTMPSAIEDEARASSASRASTTSTLNSSGPDDDDDAAARERWTQAHLAAPVFVNMCVKTLCDIVTIGFVGRLEDPSSAMGGWALAQTLLNARENPSWWDWRAR